MGGEKGTRRSHGMAVPGSPPRGRGKATGIEVPVSAERITPAWAGKRLSCSGMPRPAWDHPRVGGEKPSSVSRVSAKPGSPPRGRGKDVDRADVPEGVGITPAWAGKSPRLHQRPAPSRGSPPRGRGKGRRRLPGKRRPGITPAWAGKSVADVAAVVGARDHPRVGGEKFEDSDTLQTAKGSPPRGRGKVQGDGETEDSLGITPAWAGKSPLRPPGWARSGDHPRVGGEKLMLTAAELSPPGSPPRGRGKVVALQTRTPSAGITPAWAGKRGAGGDRGRDGRDHPRVGGEKANTAVGPIAGKGSPPRGRGKDHRSRPHLFSCGITPAWAGKRLKRSHRSGIFISGPIPFHSVLHRPAGSGGSRAGRDGSPAGQPQNTGPA